MLTREVTHTRLVCAKMEMQEGIPVAVPVEDVTLLGNVTREKAQKHVHKEIGENVRIFEVHPETKIYELPVEEFLKVASVKVEEPETEQEQAS